MPEQTEVSAVVDATDVTARVRSVETGLTALLDEAHAARLDRSEVAQAAGTTSGQDGDGGGAVCAWNHFENIPTFYNWNNRPR